MQRKIHVYQDHLHMNMKLMKNWSKFSINIKQNKIIYVRFFYNEILIYKTVLKSIWTYGLQLSGCQILYWYLTKIRKKYILSTYRTTFVRLVNKDLEIPINKESGSSWNFLCFIFDVTIWRWSYWWTFLSTRRLYFSRILTECRP